MPLALDLHNSSSAAYRGAGYLGGVPAAAPEGADGRARKLNTPSVVRVLVFDPDNMAWIAGTRSAEDGTWKICCLALDRPYLVLGLDPLGKVNAAVQAGVFAAPMDP